MTMKYRLLGALAAVAMFSATNANAQASQNINVQATVPPVCVINGGGTAATLDFGAADVTNGTDSTATLNFTWRCTAGTNVEIELDAGTTPGSDPATARLLENTAVPGETLSYLLCQDLACTQPWGDGATATDIVTVGAGMGSPATLPIYGLLDGTVAQGAAPGTYTETVVLSLVF